MPKTYSSSLLETLENHIENAPPKAPKYLTHDELLQALKGKVRLLYEEKNYDVVDIVRLLKEGGFQVTQRDVKGLLADLLQNRPKVPRRPRNSISKG
jgi:hypothetical protein